VEVDFERNSDREREREYQGVSLEEKP